MNAKFFPGRYAQDLEEIKKSQPEEFSNKLDDFTALMIGVVKSQEDKNAALILATVLDNTQLKATLEERLVPNQNQKVKSKKI